MDILYLSSMCSSQEYERMFNKYGTILSHASLKFNRLLTEGMIENGCEIYALTQRLITGAAKDDVCRADETENGIRFRYLRRYNNKIMDRLMTVVNAYREICRWSRQHPNGILVCDIIFGELSIAAFLAMRLKHIKGVAIVTDVPAIRAGDVRKGIKNIPVNIKNGLIAAYDGYIFLTEQMNITLNPKHRPYALVEGVVDRKVMEELNTLDNKYAEKVCIMAGLLEDVFGTGMLISAFERVEAPDARLVFYGHGSAVRDIIAASERDARISYKGELLNQQLVREEKRAALMINPRSPEGVWTAYSFPSKNMEYMASGTPLLGFDLPCIPEEYKPYFFAFDEYSAESMGDTLNKLLSMDKEELHDFGLRAQQWVVENKNPSVCGRKIRAMLDKVSI